MSLVSADLQSCSFILRNQTDLYCQNTLITSPCLVKRHSQQIYDENSGHAKTLWDFMVKDFQAGTLIILATEQRISQALYEACMVWAHENHCQFDWLPLQTACGCLSIWIREQRLFQCLLIPPHYSVREDRLYPRVTLKTVNKEGQ